MSKEEKNKSNKKNTTTKNNSTKKKVENKVTDTKTKATKKDTNKKAEKKQEENIKVLDSIYEKEYDEDLEMEETEMEGIKVVKPTKETKKSSKERIEKIEKIAKENNHKKGNSKKTSELLLTLDKNRHIIYSFIGGALLVTLIAFIIWPDRIAALKNGEEPVVKVGKNTYTADELYTNMKDYYSVSLLLDDIDNDLLTELYPEDDKMKEEVESNAEYYLNMYEQYYGYTEEEFLSANGFSSYNAFIEYLTLDYRRNQYLDNYIVENTSDDEIEKYYNENVFGDINTQHILVEYSDDSEDEEALTEEEAKDLAEEIITKLNDGTSWEDIQKEYKDQITFEDLGYQSWDASLEESFMTALKDMEDNTYSEEPVQTSYGYHIIYRIDQKEKPSLKESKETILNNIKTNKKAEDSNLLYKSLINLREDNNIDFKDTVMKAKYEKYCDQYK